MMNGRHADDSLLYTLQNVSIILLVQRSASGWMQARLLPTPVPDLCEVEIYICKSNIILVRPEGGLLVLLNDDVQDTK
jgi:hypothetical protein